MPDQKSEIHFRRLSMALVCIGHRGACGYEPENTLRSFSKAIEQGAEAIEFDVYFVDGELLVIHDDTLERTTNGQGRVMDKKLDDLRSLDAGAGEKIPTLKEVLDLVNRRVWVNIELKGPKTADPVCRLLQEYISKGWSLDDFLVSSFDHAELKKAKTLLPELRVGVLFSRWRWNMVGFARSMGATAINPSLKIVKPSLVQAAHRAGLKVFVYTVNEQADLDRLASMGVDGVFTNYPDRVASHPG